MKSVAGGRAKPVSSPWILYSWGNNGLYRGSDASGVSGDVATFSFPVDVGNTAYPAFLTTTTVQAVLGNLTGKALLANLTISDVAGTTYRYGGQGTWNLGSLPANVRLFISTSAAVYNLNDAQQNEDSYWWSQVAWAQVQNGTFTLTDTFDPAHWSNAQGHLASDRLAAFQAVVANVRQIGASFGGGNFFDVGVALLSGQSTFHLHSYTAQ